MPTGTTGLRRNLRRSKISERARTHFRPAWLPVYRHPKPSVTVAVTAPGGNQLHAEMVRRFRPRRQFRRATGPDRRLALSGAGPFNPVQRSAIQIFSDARVCRRAISQSSLTAPGYDPKPSTGKRWRLKLDPDRGNRRAGSQARRHLRNEWQYGDRLTNARLAGHSRGIDACVAKQHPRYVLGQTHRCGRLAPQAHLRPDFRHPDPPNRHHHHYAFALAGGGGHSRRLLSFLEPRCFRTGRATTKLRLLNPEFFRAQRSPEPRRAPALPQVI